MESGLSSPSPERLRCWRLYVERARTRRHTRHRARAGRRHPAALVRRPRPPRRVARGHPHERTRRTHPLQQGGFTRVVDRMEETGLVRRLRPEHDRRTILVLLTDKGTQTLEHAQPPPRRNPTTLLPTPHHRRHQSPHPRTRKDQHPRTTTPPRPHPQLKTQSTRQHRKDVGEIAGLTHHSLRRASGRSRGLGALTAPRPEPGNVIRLEPTLSTVGRGPGL